MQLGNISVNLFCIETTQKSCLTELKLGWLLSESLVSCSFCLLMTGFFLFFGGGRGGAGWGRLHLLVQGAIFVVKKQHATHCGSGFATVKNHHLLLQYVSIQCAQLIFSVFCYQRCSVNHCLSSYNLYIYRPVISIHFTNG